MFAFDTRNIIHTWKYPILLHAVQEGDRVAFYHEKTEKEQIFVHLIQKTIGWVNPQEIPPERLKNFYSKFKPMLIEGDSTVMFCLFINKVSGLVVGFLHNRKFCVQFFPEVGRPFLIAKIRDISLPSYEDVIEYNYYGTVDDKINEWPMIVNHQDRSLQLGTMQLFVKVLSGKTITIDIKPNASIETLTQLVEAKTDISRNRQKLIFGGKQLNNRRDLSENSYRTLCDWNIQKETTIHLVLDLRGGGLDPFSFSHMENEKRVPFGEEGAPLWRCAATGLNLLAMCDNRDCEAFGDICIQIGIGTFDMDQVSTMSKCPECSTIAKGTKSPLFYACLFSIVGTKEDGTEVERLDIRAPDDEFLMFESKSDDSEKWESLVITTKDIHAPAPLPSKTDAAPASKRGCTLF